MARPPFDWNRFPLYQNAPRLPSGALDTAGRTAYTGSDERHEAENMLIPRKTRSPTVSVLRSGGDGKQFLRRLGTFLGGVLFFFTIVAALGEIALRLFPPASLARELYALNWIPDAFSFARFDPDYAHRHPPNGRFVHASADYRAVYTTDAEGFRAVANRAPAGAPLVLLLGDSYAFGTSQNDDETMAQRLADLGRFRVADLGQSGYGTAGELMLLLEQGPSRRPDAVVLVACSNDYWDNDDGLHPRAHFDAADFSTDLPPDAEAIFARLRAEAESGRGLFALQPTLDAGRVWRGLLLRHSRSALAYSLLAQTAVDALRPRFGLQDPPLGRFPREQLMEKLLVEAAVAAGSLGAPLIVARTAERLAVENPEERTRRHLAQATAEIGLPYLDLNAVFAARADWRGLFHPLDGHWSPEGAKVVADALAPFIEAHLPRFCSFEANDGAACGLP
ncbi:MAG: hypothetical protein C4523_08475 [Myxococcales bacterium]|nr:MAG: hypothetical protein C4523_08475 [Myxococcales bacterium]